MSKATSGAAFWEYVAGMFQYPVEGAVCPVCGSSEVVGQERDPSPAHFATGGEGLPPEAFGTWRVCTRCEEQWQPEKEGAQHG